MPFVSHVHVIYKYILSEYKYVHCFVDIIYVQAYTHTHTHYWYKVGICTCAYM